MFPINPTSIRTILLAFPCLALCNCTAQHAQLNSSTQSITIEHSAPNIEVLSELAVLNQIPTQPLSAGPQLVAGDWLAWQCADAGQYWDLPSKNAPTFLYAGAYESTITD